MHNFLTVGLAVPKLHLANPAENAKEIIEIIKEANTKHVDLLIFPELAITGATCGDLFKSQHLIKEAQEAIDKIAKSTFYVNVDVLIGTPYLVNTKNFQGKKPFNTMVHIKNGFKEYFAKNIEIDQERFFSKPNKTDFSGAIIFEKTNTSEKVNTSISLTQTKIKFDTDIFIDPWAKPSDITKKHKSNLKVLSEQGKAFLSVSPGSYESTTDFVYTGDMIVAENGQILIDEKAGFSSKLSITYIDIDLLSSKRMSNKKPVKWITGTKNLTKEEFYEGFAKHRKIDTLPFIPKNNQTFDDIIHLQGTSIARRMIAAKADTAVLGLSGGVDSTLSLLAILKAFEILEKNKKDIILVTMPGLGTSSGTKNNAKELAKAVDIELREISIVNAVKSHFDDIGHNGEPDVTYENAQARERTQILMDLANMNNGLHIGTGDLSESMLGWATYNGDHSSMYNPNGGLPKTLIQHTLIHVANTVPYLKEVILDILKTPISPELLPAKNDAISQKTEDIVGSYEVNDFFIFYTLKGIGPKKLMFLAEQAFKTYEKQELKKQLIDFYKRFFSSQFKRSMSSDGPKILDISISPRGGLVMPSDATYESWITELDDIV